VYVKSVACSGAEFSCRHGACISQSLVCDGVEDCPTGDDEAPHLCGTTIRLRLLPSLDANAHVITLAARTVVKVTFTARRYANAVCVVVLCMSVCLSVCLYVCQSVCHKPVLCRNDWTNRAGFWHGGYLPPIPHCVIRKFGYIRK